MTTVDVDEIADRLYGLPPEEFTSARAQEAKRAGSAYLRKAIIELRKPTAAAHAVNQLVRDRAADMAALFALGEQLREAMGTDATEVRRLTDERRKLIARLVEPDLSPAVQEEVRGTLEAATADADMAAAIRTGRLVKSLQYAGFGASMPTPKPSARPTPTVDLTAARDRVLELSGIADDAQRRYETAVKNATEARQILEAAEAERAEAHKDAKAAHAEAEKARRELGRLERS